MPTAAQKSTEPEPVTEGDSSQPPSDVPATVTRSAWWRRRAVVVAAAVLGSWALPPLLHVIGLDALLVVLIVLVSASLVRGVRTVVDQVVIATVTLFGLSCAAGLVITWLSLGIHPVLLAGTALTVLVAVAVGTGRRPAMARAPRPVDGVMLASLLGVALLLLRQFVKRDAIGRLALLAPGEDLARHFILYDAIERLGGYAFLRPDDVADLTPADHANYPQGLHWLFAVVGRFWRSSSEAISGAEAMDWLVWCHVATYVWFAAAVLWAVRRMAGPGLAFPASIVVFGSASAYLFFGDPLTIFLRAFPNELAGLGLAAVAISLLARPLTRQREQLVVLSCLLVGIGFTYYLYLPVLAVTMIAWFAPRWRPTLRLPVTVALASLFALLAFVPAASNPKANQGSQFLLLGTAIPVDPTILLAVFLIIGSGLIVGSGLRSVAWRTWTVCAASAATLAIGISLYQYVETGRSSSYYGEKAYHLVIVVAILGMGAAARLVPALTIPAGSRLLGQPRQVLGSAVLALAVFAMFGAINGPASSSDGGSYGMGLVRGREGVVRDGPAVAYDASRAYPSGDGRVTVDLSHGPWANFYGTLYGLAMQRTYVVGVDWYAFLYPDGPERTIADLEEQVLATSLPIRFIVSDSTECYLTGEPAMTNIEAARYLADKYPDRVEVVSLSD